MGGKWIICMRMMRGEPHRGWKRGYFELVIFADFYVDLKKYLNYKSMWVCEWLCPKRKKKPQAYDVHEDTFEMDQNVGDLVDYQKDQMKKSQIPPQQSNQVLTSEVQKEQTETEKKFMENKNKINEEEAKVQVQVNAEKQFVQNKNKIQEEAPPQVKVEEKKVDHPNILKSKKPIKKKYNPDDYQFVNEEGSFKVKKIDSIKQQQYNIDKCKNCDYFIFDITANLYIDDSEDCFIFVAPCESTIFVRNCKNMIIVAATGQFRTYECHNCHFSLYCKSQPVIESSSDLHFSSLNCPEYEGMKKQFQKLKREPWNNHWSEIHNFTKKQGQNHYTLSREPEFQKQVDWQKAYLQAELEFVSKQQKIVPFIQGALQLEHPEGTLYLFVFSKDMSSKNDEIIEWIQKNELILLKAEKRKFEGHGKHELVAIEVLGKKEIELDLQEVQNPTTYMNKQAESKESAYFVNFGDERGG